MWLFGYLQYCKVHRWGLGIEVFGMNNVIIITNKLINMQSTQTETQDLHVTMKLQHACMLFTIKKKVLKHLLFQTDL